MSLENYRRKTVLLTSEMAPNDTVFKALFYSLKYPLDQENFEHVRVVVMAQPSMPMEENDVDMQFWNNASQPNIDAVWDNNEDDVYEKLLDK